MGYFIIKDETLFGEVLQEQRLEIPLDTVTVRDIIAVRVGEEVRKVNERTTDRYQFLLDLAPARRRSQAKNNPLTGRQIDPAKPIAKAIAAFEANAFFLLIGNRQVESLDEEVTAAQELEVSFVKLTALIGG